MRVKFCRNALKFRDKINEKDRERIDSKIKSLLQSIEEHGIIPFEKLDIKKLSGTWDGFLRLRTGKIRVIFKINIETDELWIYEIDFRGQAYRN